MPRSNISLKDWCTDGGYHDILTAVVNPVDAVAYSYSSHTKILWECPKGHRFERSISNMTKVDAVKDRPRFSCTVCNGKQVVVGVNDLATTRPDLALEWNYGRNGKLQPTQVTKGSFKTVWWRCARGHEWQARISARDYRNGCPFCASSLRSSIPEQLVFQYTKKYFPDALNMYSVCGTSVDIYIPSRKIAIEFDGSYYHEMHNTDYKFEKLRGKNVILLTLSGLETSRPNTVSFNDVSLNVQVYPNPFTVALGQLFKQYLGVVIDFSDYATKLDLARKAVITDSGRVAITEQMRSMWSPLNGYAVEYIQNNGANKLWRCEHGHTFPRRYDVIKRVGLQCPYCIKRLPFEFYCIGILHNKFIVLDNGTGEVESVLSSECLEYMLSGINIYGITLENSAPMLDASVYNKIGSTAFRNYFVKYQSEYMIALSSDVVDFVSWLNNVFHSEYIDRIKEKYFTDLRRGTE